MSEKYLWFNEVKFTRDDKTGYYLNSTLRIRMHRYVWEFYNGEIPEGYQIHHMDRDKANNNISNLSLIKTNKHYANHGKERFLNETEWFEDFHKKGIEEAKVWHKSEEGKNWHKEQYEQNKDKLHKKIVLHCEYCGSEFETIDTGRPRFCSNKCKSAWRRKEGLDNETRICKQCGVMFVANKYSKTECCSRACSNKLYPRLPQLRKN